MKSKLLLLVLCCSVVLFGCKKDKSPEDKVADAKKQVIGTWQVQNTAFTYYDASDKVVDSDNSDTNNGETFQFVDGSTLKTSESSNSSYAYTITNVDGKVMLNVSNQSFELKFSGDNAMSWSQEKTIADDPKYAKSVAVIQFTKK